VEASRDGRNFEVAFEVLIAVKLLEVKASCCEFQGFVRAGAVEKLFMYKVSG
jgi:hypothetical protein